MSINTESLYKEFNLTPPGEEGAKEQEPTTPAAAEGNEDPKGVNEQEPAKPADIEEPDDDRQVQEEGEDSEELEDPKSHAPGKEELTLEQRRANAARRRKQEQAAAIQAAVQQARQEEQGKSQDAMKNFIAGLGMVNNFTGKPITTVEEAMDWKRQMDADRANRELKAGKLTAETLEQIVGNHPAVQQAQAMVQQVQQQEESQRKAQEKQRIDGELQEIGKLAATLGKKVEGIGDLLTMEKAGDFKAYVDKGYSFLDAYKLAHEEEFVQAKAAAATQAAMNKSRGKEHLKGAGAAQGTGALTVPPEVMRMYRAVNPKATDAQIQAHYNKSLKK